MPDDSQHAIIVIGASAGGIEPLLAIVQELPADLPAAVFVVVHTPPHASSRLPEILARVGPLPAAHARDGEPIVPGRIYVAPPDRHLLLRPGRVELTRGPRENHSRPAVDPLFRSASRAYGSRVTGVILSGALYDGVAGLLAIQTRGGQTIIQDADEAIVPSMPARAQQLVDADFVLPAAEIGRTLARLTGGPPEAEGDETMASSEDEIARVIENDFQEQVLDERGDETSVYSCPDCGGVLWQVDEGAGAWFRCHVGHAYGPEVLLGLKSEDLEAALWTCIRLLRERSALTRQTAARTRAGGSGDRAARIEEQALHDERQADLLRELVETMPTPIEPSVPAGVERENEPPAPDWPKPPPD